MTGGTKMPSGAGAWLLGPVAVCLSSALVVVHAAGRPFSRAGMALFLAGVVAAYVLDRWNDQPAGQRHPGLPMLAGFASVAGFFAVLELPWPSWMLAAMLGLVALAYRQLKKFPLAKTLLVATAWTAAAVAFPVQWPVSNAMFFTPLTLALLAIFAAGALLCDFKDIADDAKQGVHTVPVLWGRKAAGRLAFALAVTGLGAALFAGRPGLAASALALAVLAVFPRVLARPVLGPALVDGMLALPALLILAGAA